MKYLTTISIMLGVGLSFGIGAYVYAAATLAPVQLQAGQSVTVSCATAATTPPPAPPPSPAPTPTPPPPPPAPTPTPPLPPVTGGKVLTNVWITGYADGDNTPPGVPTTYLNGITGTAGGNCTYANPTTIAVGHVITNGNDVGDFAYGTKFYVGDMKGGGCYFIAQDTCGDGSTPQNIPCHKPEQGSLQLDAYVGPNGSASCEDSMTMIHSTVIENPPAGLSATAHNICNN